MATKLNNMSLLGNLKSVSRIALNFALAPVTAPINAFRYGRYISEDGKGEIREFKQLMSDTISSTTGLLFYAELFSPYGTPMDNAGPVGRAVFLDEAVSVASFFAGLVYGSRRRKISDFMDSRIVEPIERRLRGGRISPHDSPTFY